MGLNSGWYCTAQTSDCPFVKVNAWTSLYLFDASTIESSGILPAGEYELYIRSYNLGLYSNRKDNEQKEIDPSDRKINMSYISEVTGELLNLNIPEQINLLSPNDLESIYDSNPWFRWDSPGFGSSESPITVEYRVSVALFNPELHSSLTD